MGLARYGMDLADVIGGSSWVWTSTLTNEHTIQSTTQASSSMLLRAAFKPTAAAVSRWQNGWMTTKPLAGKTVLISPALTLSPYVQPEQR